MFFNPFRTKRRKGINLKFALLFSSYTYGSIIPHLRKTTETYESLINSTLMKMLREGTGDDLIQITVLFTQVINLSSVLRRW